MLMPSSQLKRAEWRLSAPENGRPSGLDNVDKAQSFNPPPLFRNRLRRLAPPR
jgi:hypothetical protein